ncbi:MAG: coenzyme F420-0:L-glutamate ligase [Anaerolineaceae bacterium]|nr:coenzyme F420-0:L-glutamate ligase [Anaerolineaceae bacterium]
MGSIRSIKLILPVSKLPELFVDVFLDEIMPLILQPLPNLPLINQGDNLVEIIIKSLSDASILIEENDILVFAQKVVSKAEGRMVCLESVEPTERAVDLAQKINKDPRLVELILRESKTVLRANHDVLIVEHRNGFVCANAGIDHSNVSEKDDCVLLLPKNPDDSAQKLQDGFFKHFSKRIGILIIDSHGRAWRMGTIGMTIGISSVPGIVDKRGSLDLFGYRMQHTQIAAADELAAAASLMMGQVDEGTPVIHVRGFPYPVRRSSFKELIRPIELDLFR